MSNPQDNRIAVIKEVEKGVTPVAPAFVVAEAVTGGVSLTYDLKDLNSETMKRSRDQAGMRKVAGNASGSIKFEFSRNAVILDFLAAALSGKLENGVCKGSNIDTSFTLEETMYEGANAFYRRSHNQHVSKATLTVDATGKAQITFDFVGGARDHSEDPVTAATYTTPAKGKELAGIDLGTIAIGSLVARYNSLEVTIEQPREANHALGYRDAIEVGTNGNRVVKVTAKAYRKDLTAEDMFINDTAYPVEIDFGSGADGVGFVFPAMVGSVPKDEMTGSSAMVTLTLTANYSDEEGFGSSFKLLD